MKFPTEKAFNLVDSFGLPFDVLNDLLKINGFFLDVHEFIQIASKSSNFKEPSRLRNMLLENISVTNKNEVILIIERIISFYYPEQKNKKKRIA